MGSLRLDKMVWHLIPFAITALFIAPVIFGLFGTWLPAFGYFPAIGHDHFSVEPWIALFHYPGFFSALKSTLFTGIAASVISLYCTLFLLRATYPSRFFKFVENALSPILSIPHAAFAIGLGFLIAPSGWLLRLVAELTGAFQTPVNWTTFQDPLGISLIVTLVLKEIPFLLFTALATLPSLTVNKTLWLAKSQGHSENFAWRFLITPQLFPRIRLPFFAVIAYSLTVVDIALIAGPTTPPTLSVLILQRFNDPDLTQRLLGAAGATLLLVLVIGVLILFTLLERLVTFWRIQRLEQQTRRTTRSASWLGKTFAISAGVIYVCALLVTLLWSLAERWRYPNLLPSDFGVRAWLRVSQRIEAPFWCTFFLALAASLIAIALAIIALENECRLKQQQTRLNLAAIQWLLYFPLLVPQIAFLFGFQIALIHIGIDQHFVTLVWSHLVFVLPYVFLTLSGPYRQFDPRYSWQGLTLTGSPLKTLLLIKLPMLFKPILYAFATGFSVSIAQYLPTLFIGAGHYSTITTEAVAMATGGDRRMMAVMALWQQALPFMVFIFAITLPKVIFRHRKAMT